MGRHTSEQAAEIEGSNPGLPRRRILLLALGVTSTLVAWGVLVYAAIDFGQEARSGETAAWVLLIITTLGAAACLFVTLLLGARILALLQGKGQVASPPPPPRPRPTRPPGGHRAVREPESRRRPARRRGSDTGTP